MPAKKTSATRKTSGGGCGCSGAKPPYASGGSEASAAVMKGLSPGAMDIIDGKAAGGGILGIPGLGGRTATPASRATGGTRRKAAPKKKAAAPKKKKAAPKNKK